MKNRRFVLVGALSTILLVISFGRGHNKADETYEQLWEQAHQLSEKQLPQSALRVINRLYDKALAEGNQQQMLRALVFSFGLRQSFEDAAYKNAIDQMRRLTATAAFPVKEIAHSMLAEMYWNYYQQNRYNILERSVIANPLSDDPDQWDAIRYREAILHHYQQSLRNQAELEGIMLKDWALVLQKTEAQAFELQPTLFEFLAGRYLEYLSNADAGLQSRLPLTEVLPQGLWQPAASFGILDLPKQDHETWLRLRLMQRILITNIRLGHTHALIYNELHRFSWLLQLTGDKKAYAEALEQLRTHHLSHPASAEVDADLAELLRRGFKPGDNDMPLAEAIRVCNRAIENFPDSRGAARCRNIKAEILQQSLNLSIQRTEYPRLPIAAHLTYRNVTRPAFRIARVNSQQLADITQQFDPQKRVEALLQLKPLHQWKPELPFEPDYAEHSTIIALPPLAPGLYALMASTDDSFAHDNILAFTSFQVSRLSFMQVNRRGTNEFIVLDRQQGNPLGGAKVRVNVREYDYNQQKNIEKTILELSTPKNGRFSIGPEQHTLPRNQSFYIEISLNGDTLMSDNYFDVYRITEPQRSQFKTWLFTDRAIYRPGQVVYFKGISLIKNHGQPWMPETDKSTTVKLFDVNGREVGAISLKTNNFGSFGGSFILPANMLTGMMRLSNESGMTFVQVEEYKRPTFEIHIAQPEKQFSLGDSVRLKAEAKALAGYAIDGAKVEYRVERQVYQPYIPWWRPFPPSNISQLISTGTSVTDDSGIFEISFKALPDYSIPTHEVQYYDFRITAWVTDRHGEVRQATSTLRAGNRSLLLSHDLAESINKRSPGEPKLRLTTLQGTSATAQTTFRFYKLEAPEAPVRPAIFPRPDRQVINNKELKELFPYDDFYASVSPDSLNKTLISEYRQLVIGEAAALPNELLQWPEGNYLAEYVGTDASGKEVMIRHQFTLYDISSRRAMQGNVFWVSPLKQNQNPGDTLQIVFSSAYRGMRVLVEISSESQIFLRSWFVLGNNKRRLSLVLANEHIGSLSVQITGVALNRHFHRVMDVNVNNPARKIDIKTETIAERLMPGRQERWTLRIVDNNNRPVEAELLASMYDASLEQFKPHNWSFNPQPAQPFAQRWMSDNGFSLYHAFMLNRPNWNPVSVAPVTIPLLNWFGFIHPNQYIRDGIMLRGPKAQNMSAVQDVDMKTIVELQSETPTRPSEEATNGFAARQLRSDFRETAFFYPQLQTDSLGRINIGFQTPDALTRWRLLLLVHTSDLRHQMLTMDFEASKPLMISPNVARFYRYGDTAMIAAKVVNSGNQTIDGLAMLQLSDAVTGEPLKLLQDADLKPFIQLKPGQSTELRWTVVFMSMTPLLRLKFSASAGTFTDAEEHLIPLLPAGIQLTETLPVHIQGRSSGTLLLPGLEKPNPAERNLKLKLEVTTHPAWVAVKSLPYVADIGSENADNIFRQYYTNTLAAHVAASLPNFDAVLRHWTTEGGMQSELAKNQDVKIAELNQTPWLAESESEHAQRQRLAMLFDLNQLNLGQKTAIEKLGRMQLPDGSWPWFPGMRGNLWVTLHMLEGFGKLMQIATPAANVQMLDNMLRLAVGFADRRAVEIYNDMMSNKPSAPYPYLQLLTTRSYFKDVAMSDEASKAYAYFGNLARKEWTTQGVDAQARLALHFGRLGEHVVATSIAASLKERAVRSPKLGMWWKAGQVGNQALPVETHALLVQVFELIAEDRTTADEIRQYLLSQKQTRRWVTGKATAEAIYALLMHGSTWTDVGLQVQINFGGNPLEIGNQEAGTGYFSMDLKPDVANARVEIYNPNQGPVWAGLYRQFETSLDAIKSSANEIKLSREIMVERNSLSGVRLEPWQKGGIKPGDRIKVRLVLETSRDLEFVHLRDLRSPAFEPTDVLSGYQWRNGLGFYQSTRDAFTDFFFDFLPRGKHVFEYGLVAVQRGNFNGGFAQLQSYYAPAFSAFSSGSRIAVD